MFRFVIRGRLVSAGKTHAGPFSGAEGKLTCPIFPAVRFITVVVGWANYSWRCQDKVQGLTS